MALSRTFIDGDLLTSADINDHLVHRVPNPGDVYDTGWINVALASGFSGSLQVRRIGYEVHWTGQVTRTAGAFAVGTTYTVVAPGGVPAGFYSTSSFTRNAGAAINVVGLTAYFGVGTDGSIAMRVSVSGNDFQTSPVNYTVG